MANGKAGQPRGPRIEGSRGVARDDPTRVMIRRRLWWLAMRPSQKGAREAIVACKTLLEDMQDAQQGPITVPGWHPQLVATNPLPSGADSIMDATVDEPEPAIVATGPHDPSWQ